MKKLLIICSLILIGCSPTPQKDTRLICDCTDTSYEFKEFDFLGNPKANPLGAIPPLNPEMRRMWDKYEQVFKIKRVPVQRPNDRPSKNACGIELAKNNNVLVLNETKNKFSWNGENIGAMDKEKVANSISWQEDTIEASFNIPFDKSLTLKGEAREGGTATKNTLILNKVNLNLYFRKMPLVAEMRAIADGQLRRNEKGEWGLEYEYSKEIMDRAMQVSFQCRIVEGL